MDLQRWRGERVDIFYFPVSGGWAGGFRCVCSIWKIVSPKIKKAFPEGRAVVNERVPAQKRRTPASFFSLSSVFFAVLAACPRQKPDTLLAVRFPALLTIYVNSARLTRAAPLALRSYGFLIARARSPSLALVYLTGGARPSEQRRATSSGTGRRNGGAAGSARARRVAAAEGRTSPPFFRFSTRGSPPTGGNTSVETRRPRCSRRSRPPIV